MKSLRSVLLVVVMIFFAGLLGLSLIINPDEATITIFPIWKTIQLGTGLQTVDDCRQALVDSGCRITDEASYILNQDAFTLAKESTELDLVVLSAAELGLVTYRVTYADICQRAQDLGLRLCPVEVGVQLRLQYMDQPKYEWLRIAVEPITDPDGYLVMFCVGHDDLGLWLRSADGRPVHHWYTDDRFVFVSPK